MVTFLSTLVCLMIFLICTAAVLVLISRAPLMDDRYDAPRFLRDLPDHDNNGEEFPPLADRTPEETPDENNHGSSNV